MAFVDDHAVDLLFTFSAFLIVYVIARLMKASPLVAMCFGVLPPLVAYLLQHPGGAGNILALLK